MFIPYKIIKEKRDGKILSKEEIYFMVHGYTKGEIPDYQFSAFLMAVFFKGMTDDELFFYTNAIIESGKKFDLSKIPLPKIDKHSTGGVGDKVSLVLAPLVASCGVCVPMVSGRALGHTGGTLDKLESIPGFKTSMDHTEFLKLLQKTGFAIIGQTEELCPADRKIYALRDVTATVDSIPLIAASIMSKKIAEGIEGLVLDVKTGNGAFMKKEKDAEELAKKMISIGKKAGVKTLALLTDMSKPLGRMVGNSLEIIEAIETLKGNGPSDLTELVLSLAEKMLELAKIKNPHKLLEQNIKNGKALEKLKEMIKNQNGNPGVIDNYSLLPLAKEITEVKSPMNGYIYEMDTEKIGMLLVELGGGRKKKEDTVDHGVGFEFLKKTGDKVKKGETIVKIYADIKKAKRIEKELLNTIKIETYSPPISPLIKKILH